MINRLSSKLIYQDKWLKFFVDDVRLPDGKQGTYAHMQRQDGVGIVIVNQSQEVVLVKVFRYPIQQYSWEIPGGGIEPHQTPQEAALEEAREESGIKLALDNLQPLGSYYSLNSLNTERVTLFAARFSDSATKSSQPTDSEVAEKKVVPLAKAIEMIVQGEITDCMTAQALWLYQYHFTAKENLTR